MEIDSDSTAGMPEETAAENSSSESVRKVCKSEKIKMRNI